jgi:hypothetical protein
LEGLAVTKYDTARLQLVSRARLIRVSIDAHLVSVKCWNETIRRPDEAPIDPDPDGTLARMAAALDRVLVSESKVGTLEAE